MSESYMSKPSLIGVLFIATTKIGSQLVFHYPPSENFMNVNNSSNSENTDSNGNIVDDNNDSENDDEDDQRLDKLYNDQNLHFNVHASSYTSNPLSNYSMGQPTNANRSYLMEYFDEEFDEDFVLSDDDNSTAVQTKDLKGEYDSEDNGDDENEEDEDSDEDDYENADNLDILDEEDFDVETDYDSNNPLMSFEEFNNEYFIENILDDQLSLAKLKYKVSYECSAKLAEIKALQDKNFYKNAPPHNPNNHKKHTSTLEHKSPKTLITTQDDSLSLSSNKAVVKRQFSDVGKKLDAHKNNLTKRVNGLKNQLNKVFTFNNDYLCEMLSPSRGLCNDQFELKVDRYCFLSFPVNENGLGGWSKFYKKKYLKFRKYQKKQMQRRKLQIMKMNKNKESEVSEKEYYSSELLLDVGDKHMTSENSDYKSIHEDEDGENEGSESENKLEMFNIVFVMNPPSTEYNMKKNELHENILSKLTYILSKEQGRSNYVENEVAKINEIKDQFFNKFCTTDKGTKLNIDRNNSHCSGNSTVSDADSTDIEGLDAYISDESLTKYFTVQNLYKEILLRSSLARVLYDCYNNLLSSQIFTLRVNENPYSFNIPIKKNFSVLPHSSIKLKNINANVLLTGSSQIDSLVLEELEDKKHKFGISKPYTPKTKNTIYIGTLFDEYFYQNNLFPSVTNLSKINNYYYLNNFQGDLSSKDLNEIDFQISRIFKKCSYDIYSLLILEDLNEATKEVPPEISKDFKYFVKKIDAAVPLKKIITNFWEERLRKTTKYKNRKKTDRRKTEHSSQNANSLLNNVVSEEDKEAFVISMIYHLIYWEKVKFVLPINKRTKFVISPLANLGTDINDVLNNKKQGYLDPIESFGPKKFNQLDNASLEAWLKGINKKLFEEFKLAFPSLPSLSEFLSYFNTPRSYSFFSKNKQKSESFLDACCWLMKNGLIVQYFTFGWLVLTSRIKIQVEEDMGLMQNRIVRNGGLSNALTFHNSSKITLTKMKQSESFKKSAKNSFDTARSDMIKKAINETSHPSLDPKPAFEGSALSSNNSNINLYPSPQNQAYFNGINEGLASNEEDSILLNPDRPSLMEKRFIQKMLANKSKETKTIFYKILKYLNGKIPLELVLLKEGIKRSDLRKVIDEMEEYIIIDNHW